MYEKHNNIINGIYLDRNPVSWVGVSVIDNLDAIDEDNELYSMLSDANIYDIDEIDGFDNPCDIHGIRETIFIIRRCGKYYLCETQGVNYVKFSIDISNVDYIKNLDRLQKIKLLNKKSGLL